MDYKPGQIQYFLSDGATRLSVIQEAHPEQATDPLGKVRQLQVILKIRKNPPQSWFGLKQSCNPIRPKSSPNAFSLTSKVTDNVCGFCHNDALG